MNKVVSYKLKQQMYNCLLLRLTSQSCLLIISRSLGKPLFPFPFVSILNLLAVLFTNTHNCPVLSPYETLFDVNMADAR